MNNALNRFIFEHFFCFQQSWCFIVSDGEANTPPYFVYMPDCVLNSSFSTPVPWDLHLNFWSEMIKRNLERHNWRRMSKKRSKAFVSFWVGFWYLYVPPLKKSGFTMLWYLYHTLITDSFSELTLLWLSFYGQRLTHLIMFIWTVINIMLVYFQFRQWIMHWICSFFSICSASRNLWCFIL